MRRSRRCAGPDRAAPRAQSSPLPGYRARSCPIVGRVASSRPGPSGEEAMAASVARAAGAVPELVAGTLPLLDVEPYLAGEAGALERLGAELRWAFENVGFY